MMDLKFDFGHPLTRLQAENLRSLLAYADPRVESFQITDDLGRLEVRLAHDSDAEGVRAAIEDRFARAAIFDRRQAEVETLVDRIEREVPNDEDVFPGLIARMEIMPQGPGAFTLGGRFLKMVRGLDAAVVALGEELMAEEVEHPIAVPIRAMRDSRFFKNYPQHATFIAGLTDPAEGECLATPGESVRRSLAEPTAMCRHAACLPTYASLAGARRPRHWCRTWTTLGRVFRQERHYETLERLSEFMMREIIFVGTEEYVFESLARCRDWLEATLDQLGLRGAIRTAADPFFVDQQRALQEYQLMKRSKLELILENPFNRHQVAVASINDHAAHFGKSFDIRFDHGKPVHSGCFGIGLERFVYLALCQYGPDPSAWSEELLAFFRIQLPKSRA